MKQLFTVLQLMLVASMVELKVFPSRYSYTGGENMSAVNGSRPYTENCRLSTSNIIGRTITCDTPTSTVLFDGHIPELTGLDGDKWASQLLTIHTRADTPVQITFEFTHTITGARIEVVMFSCPQWGIGVRRTEVLLGSHFDMTPIPVHTTIINSCSSLVRLCISLPSHIRLTSSLRLQFILHPDSSWVHLAEVTLYNDPNSMCSPEGTIAPPNPPTMKPSIALPTATSPMSQESENTPTLPSSHTSNITHDTEHTTMLASPEALPPEEMSTPSLHATSTTPEDEPTTMQASPDPFPDTLQTVVVIALLLLLLFLFAGLVVALFILWRCKNHKHHHTEAPHTTSHAHTAANLYEETVLGQLQSTSGGQDSHTHTHARSTPPQGSEWRETNPHFMDQRMQAVEMHNMHTPSHLAEVTTPENQLYAEVGTTRITSHSSAIDNIHLTEVRTFDNQLSAREDIVEEQINNTEVCPKESEAVYSVVNKPSPPQLPPKSMELQKELESHLE